MVGITSQRMGRLLTRKVNRNESLCPRRDFTKLLQEEQMKYDEILLAA